MKAGILGTGLMGTPMALRLMESGMELGVWNRTADKLDPLKEAGARVFGSPKELMAQVDTALVMVTDGEAVRRVLFEGVPVSTFKGRTVVVMSTIGPDESLELAGRVKAAAGRYVEAPVLGSKAEAASGRLTVMLGGEENDCARVHGLLEQLGEAVIRVGPVGRAAALKLALNQLIASLNAVFSLSLGFVIEHDVDPDLFMEILRPSSLYASKFDSKLKRMLERNFADPNFPTTHMLKDVDLFIQAGRKKNLDLAPLEGVRQVIARAVDMGLGGQDYSALYAAVHPEPSGR